MLFAQACGPLKPIPWDVGWKMGVGPSMIVILLSMSGYHTIMSFTQAQKKVEVILHLFVHLHNLLGCGDVIEEVEGVTLG